MDKEREGEGQMISGDKRKKRTTIIKFTGIKAMSQSPISKMVDAV